MCRLLGGMLIVVVLVSCSLSCYFPCRRPVSLSLEPSVPRLRCPRSSRGGTCGERWVLGGIDGGVGFGGLLFGCLFFGYEFYVCLLGEFLPCAQLGVAISFLVR